MKKFFSSIFIALIIVAIYNSCRREQVPTATSLIDVSAQWHTLDGWLILDSLPDGQWHKKTFTLQENNLFQSMDTADLSGTSLPDSIPNISNPMYATPFDTSLVFSTTRVLPTVSDEFTGQLIFKYVIVDSLLNPLVRESKRVKCENFGFRGSCFGVLIPTVSLPLGRFRLYYTLSSFGHEHFYKTWGNIEKKLF